MSLGRRVASEDAADGVVDRDGGHNSVRNGAAMSATTGSVEVRTHRVEDALAALRAGEFVVILLGLDPNDWCAICMAAERVDVDHLKKLTDEGTGMFWLCLSDERGEQLGLDPVLGDTTDESWRNALTMPISHRDNVRGSLDSVVLTVVRAADPAVERHEFEVPGLVYPLRARAGGVLESRRPIEACVDLLRLAGLQPAGVIAALANPDSSTMLVRDVATIAGAGYPMVTIDDVVRYRLRTERLVRQQSSVRLPTEYGDFTLLAFVNRITGEFHVALVKGDVNEKKNVLVRYHRECFSGSIVQSASCDCRELLERALRRLEQEGEGALVYVMSESRYTTVCARVAAGPQTGREGWDGAVASQILAELGLSTVRLLTSPGQAWPTIEGHGIQVVGQVVL